MKKTYLSGQQYSAVIDIGCSPSPASEKCTLLTKKLRGDEELNGLLDSILTGIMKQ
jgi:hypothetical protein